MANTTTRQNFFLNILFQPLLPCVYEFLGWIYLIIASLMWKWEYYFWDVMLTERVPAAHIVLVSATRQHEPAMDAHTTFASWTPSPQPRSPSSPLSCYRGWARCAVGRSPPAACFTRGHVYVSMLLSQFVPPDIPGGSDSKATACKAEDLGSIPGSGRSPGEGNGTRLQYSCLENPMDRGGW